jgi:hypothetical protein
MDSTVTTANERFDQLDLAQTATKTTLDAIVSRLDALNTVVTDLVAQGCVGDDEQEDADRHGKARCVPRRPAGNDSFSKIKFKIPPFNGKYNPAAFLDWELEVEQKFSCHDIAATKSYVLHLPTEFGVSTSFNVADLKPYVGEDDELPSRMTSVQEGEDEEDTNYITRTSTPAAPEAPRTSTPAAPEAPQAPSTPLGAPPAQTSFPPPGPITRAHARELNYIMLLKNEGPEG